MVRLLLRVLGFAYFTLFSIMLFTVPVYAYIDPATTAMITQIVAGIFISVGVAVGIFRHRIILFFKNLSVKRTERKIKNKNDRKDK